MHDLNLAVARNASAPDPAPFLRMWAATRMTRLARSTIYRLVASVQHRGGSASIKIESNGVELRSVERTCNIASRHLHLSGPRLS